LEGIIRAHKVILIEARVLARQAAERGDDGINDLLVSQVIRANELQSWFIGEHLLRRQSD
jgi:starvation-inducible DNA-binding protein